MSLQAAYLSCKTRSQTILLTIGSAWASKKTSAPLGQTVMYQLSSVPRVKPLVHFENLHAATFICEYLFETVFFLFLQLLAEN